VYLLSLLPFSATADPKLAIAAPNQLPSVVQSQHERPIPKAAIAADTVTDTEEGITAADDHIQSMVV